MILLALKVTASSQINGTSVMQTIHKPDAGAAALFPLDESWFEASFVFRMIVVDSAGSATGMLTRQKICHSE